MELKEHPRRAALSERVVRVIAVAKECGTGAARRAAGGAPQRRVSGAHEGAPPAKRGVRELVERERGRAAEGQRPGEGRRQAGRKALRELGLQSRTKRAGQRAREPPCPGALGDGIGRPVQVGDERAEAAALGKRARDLVVVACAAVDHHGLRGGRGSRRWSLGRGRPGQGGFRRSDFWQSGFGRHHTSS